VTWVCGAEKLLVEEVIEFVRAHLGASDLEYVSLVAGSVPDREVWAAINQYPVDPNQPRLVVVRDSDSIKGWAPLRDWVESASRTMPNNYLVLTSNVHDWPYIVRDGKRTADLEEPSCFIKGRGHVIRCSTPNEDDLRAWVQRQAPCSDATATHLLKRVGGDLTRAKNVCRKASLFRGEMSKAVVDALCAEGVGEEFVDALLSMDRPRALAALETMDPERYSPAIGLLDFDLAVMGQIHQALRERQSMKDMLVAADLNPFVVRRLYPHAKHYDPVRRAASRGSLAVADEALRSGARVGVMEALVALW
jgi:hypothetical protein